VIGPEAGTHNKCLIMKYLPVIYYASPDWF
jgi:hypothetical protein